MKTTDLHYKVSLDNIKKHNPCANAWEWALKNSVDGKIDRAVVLAHNKCWEVWLMHYNLCDPVTVTAGREGTAIAGYEGTATAGRGGTAIAGDEGTATAGDYGTATAGYEGTATAGRGGTATAGDHGTATAGDYGTATAGDRGIIQIYYCDDSACRYRIATAYVGENGIKPNTPYKLNYKHEFEEVEK